MNDSDAAWAKLSELDANNDLLGALALGESSGLTSEPRYARYIGWAFAQREDFLSAGKWYAKAFSLGASEAESEFQTCLQGLYSSGHRDDAAALAEIAPMDMRQGTHRTMLNLQFTANDREGLLRSSLRVAESGEPSDSRYAAELLLSSGDAETAFSYVKRASEGGDFIASQLLGEMYLQGIGVAQSDELAASAYLAPADAGLLLSRSRLAHLNRRRAGRKMNIAFYLSMCSIFVQTARLRLFNPDDVRLSGLPK